MDGVIKACDEMCGKKREEKKKRHMVVEYQLNGLYA